MYACQTPSLISRPFALSIYVVNVRTSYLYIDLPLERVFSHTVMTILAAIIKYRFGKFLCVASSMGLKSIDKIVLTFKYLSPRYHLPSANSLLMRGTEGRAPSPEVAIHTPIRFTANNRKLTAARALHQRTSESDARPLAARASLVPSTSFRTFRRSARRSRRPKLAPNISRQPAAEMGSRRLAFTGVALVRVKVPLFWLF